MSQSVFTVQEVERFHSFLENTRLANFIEPSERDRYCEFLKLREHNFTTKTLPLLVPYFKHKPLKINMLYMDSNSYRFIIVFKIGKKIKTMEATFNIDTDSIDFSLNKTNVTLLHLENYYQPLLEDVQRVAGDYRLCSEFNLGRRANTMLQLERFLMQTTDVSFPQITTQEKAIAVIQTRLDLKTGASINLKTIYCNQTKQTESSMEYSRHKKRSIYVSMAVNIKASLYDTFEQLAFKLFFNHLYSLSFSPRNAEFVKMDRF